MSRVLGLFLLAAGVLLCALGGIGVVVGLGELQRDGAGILFVFGTIAAVGVALLVAAVAVLRRTKPFVAAGGSQGGTDVYPADEPVEGELDGARYARQYAPPVKGKGARPSVLTFRTAVPCDGEFHMVEETWFDQVCKRYGLAVEVQTGDDKFDDACYVRSDTPALAAAYLTDPLKRIAILDLRRLGFREVVLRDRTLTATWTGFDPAAHHRDDLDADVAARLLILARNLPDPKPEYRTHTGSGRTKWATLLWLFLLAFGATVVALLAFTPVAATDLLVRAVPAALAGLPLFGFAAARLLRGTSRSHLSWSQVMTGALLLVPLGCSGTITWLNGVVDGSPDTAHEAVIVEKYTSKSKSKTKYHVRCATWRPGGGTISYQVSDADYGAVVPHRSRMVVTTRAGWLGVEWEKSRRVDVRPVP